MFSFFKTVVNSLYNKLSTGLSALFARTTVDEQTLSDLEQLLIEADVGTITTRHIIEKTKNTLGAGHHDGLALKKALETVLQEMLRMPSFAETDLYLLVGVNGSGKTTAAAKLALALKNEGKKVLLVAADTFRAAGSSQLQQWATSLGIDCVGGEQGQDPASVVYAGIAQFKKGGYTGLIIDTAGRLQTKTHLMKELEKIKRVITTQLPNAGIATLLTVDAMLGQNSFEQAQIFNESVHLDGVILTKCDGTGKGGIVFALADRLKLPIRYITFGESADALQLFEANELIKKIIGE